MSRCYRYPTTFEADEVHAYGDNVVPCPSGSSCCYKGDVCLSNNICQFNHTQPEGYYSGYYTSSCSDPTLTSSACPKQCTSFLTPDIVYNSTSSQWQCCGNLPNGEVTCNRPSDEIFPAPAPDELYVLVKDTSRPSKTVQSPAVATSTLTSTATTTSASVPASTSTSTSSDHPSNRSLGSGAIAGIAIGTVIVVFSIAPLLYFLLRKHKRRHTSQRDAEPNGSKNNYSDKMIAALEGHSINQYSQHSSIYEIHGTSVPFPPHELSEHQQI